MTDYQEITLGKALDMAVPEVPDVFSRAMEKTLAQIVQKERVQPRSRVRRMAVVIVAAVLLLVSVAMAVALRLNVFDALIGATPEHGQQLIEKDLAKVSFDEVDVELKEAAYDGMSLYLLYSMRERNATEPLGEYDEQMGVRLLMEETTPAIQRDNVGWWTDNIWIDGERISMPNMSSFFTTGSETPGEILYYQLYRLDQEGVFLSGETEIGLPILKRVDLTSLLRDENGHSIIPEGEENVMYFTINASARDGVTVQTPNIEASFESMRATTTSVTYSPIKLYITVGMQVPQEAVDALGEGIKDETGNVIMPYTAGDITGGWAFMAELVDKDGKRMFDTMEGFANGCQGCGETEAYFQFPYRESYPEEMYLAPMEGDTADMTRAVRVR